MYKNVSALVLLLAFISILFLFPHIRDINIPDMFSKFKTSDSVSTAGDTTKDTTQSIEKDKYPQSLDTRLPFNKKISFVYVGELNSHAVSGVSISDLVSNEVSFNEDTKALYFYNSKLIPQEADNLIVVKETNSMDTLINQQVKKDKKQVRVDFSPIYNAQNNSSNISIVNEERLFLNTSLTVTLLNDQGDVEVKYDDETKTVQTKTLKAGESLDLKVRNKQSKDGKDLKSKVLVTNFGMWNSDNMKYVVPNSK